MSVNSASPAGVGGYQGLGSPPSVGDSGAGAGPSAGASWSYGDNGAPQDSGAVATASHAAAQADTKVAVDRSNHFSLANDGAVASRAQAQLGQAREHAGGVDVTV